MTHPCPIIGHRGARGLFPENTIEGFRAAIALGVRWFELDVGVLRDGTVVVHHDLALNGDIARTPGDRWLPGPGPLLVRMDWEELQDYDVGRTRPNSPTAAAHPDQVPHDGARIPRLLDVLRLDPAIRWTIEMKLQPDRPDWTVTPEAMVEAVLAVIDEAGAATRVVLQSFDWRAPRHARSLRPEIPRSWLTNPESQADPVLWWDLETPPPAPEAIVAEGGGAWMPYWQTLTQPHIDQAHRLDLAVIPWTVNDTDAMRRLIAWGVDGLITDRPDRAPPPDAQSGDGGEAAG